MLKPPLQYLHQVMSHRGLNIPWESRVARELACTSACQFPGIRLDPCTATLQGGFFSSYLQVGKSAQSGETDEPGFEIRYI